MRQPKPYFRKQKQAWYVQIDGRQISLGRDKEAAWQRYHQLMAGRGDLSSDRVTVAQLLEAYLDWCSRNRSDGTYRNSRLYCRHFVKSVGRQLQVCQLKPKHLTAWLERHPSWSDTAKHDAISIVQRALNWATKQGHINSSPIRSFDEKPARSRREVVYSPTEFSEILTASSDDVFRDLLQFMWETGCRPIEARLVESRHVDLDHNVVILPVSLNKTRKGERVIYLTKEAHSICSRLIKAHPNGPLFRNSQGLPWTKNAIICRFTRISKKLGRKGLCAYGIRHSFATEGLKNGVDSVSLSMLMGHSDVSMIARTYQHLARNPEFLRQQAEKARGA